MIEKCRGKKKKAQHNSDESETFEMYNLEIKHLKVKKRNHTDKTATTSEAMTASLNCNFRDFNGDEGEEIDFRDFRTY